MVQKQKVDQENDNNFGGKPKRITNLQWRVISSVFIFMFMVVYVGLSIIYTQMDGKNYSEIAAWFNYVISLVLVAGTTYELLYVLKVAEKNKWFYVVGILLAELFFIFPLDGSSSIPLYNYMQVKSWITWYAILLFLIFILAAFFVLGKYSTTKTKTGLLLMIYMLVIVLGFKGFSVVALSLDPNFGFNTIIFIWGGIILTDIFAYIGGKKLGKHKLAPTVSPNKTWEGAGIGTAVSVVVATIYGCLFFYLLPDYAPFRPNLEKLSRNSEILPGIMVFLLAIVISITGQLGDLFFSFLKRVYDVKDYSDLIPGHGGLLDRLDSFLMVFSIIYFIIYIN